MRIWRGRAEGAIGPGGGPPQVVLGALLLGALLLGTFGRAQAAERVSVGSKAFTEQLLLGKMTALLLREAGFDVRERIPLGGTNIVRQALLSRQIDGYVEYTGTAATVFFKRTEPFASARECYEFVRDRDAAQGLVWLSPMAFNNTYCLMMRRQEAERLKVRTLSDLSALVARDPKALQIAVTNEFYARADGLPGMAAAYGMRPAPEAVRQMEPGLIYLAVRDGGAQVGVGFTTDGRIRAYDLVALEDDRRFFPPYNPCLVLRREVYEANRERIEGPFARLGALLTEAAITELNYEAAEKKRDPGAVAEEFLRKNGLIR